jgi:ribosomal protein L28
MEALFQDIQYLKGIGPKRLNVCTRCLRSGKVQRAI